MERMASAVVLGVGPEQGLGAALARKIAGEGLHVFIGGRTKDKLLGVADAIKQQGGLCTPLVTDATQDQQVCLLFELANNKGNKLELAVYNVDSLYAAPLLETSEKEFTRLWQQNCLGAFLFGKEAVLQMRNFHSGTVIYTGATASIKSRPPFAAFTAAKAGTRALVQAMAREYAAQGIHIVHTILDGVIDGERSRTQFAELVASKGEDGLLNLEAIADTYWNLHQQPRNSWTHELDLRPYSENF